MPTISTLYSAAFVLLSICCETGLILLPCGLFISFSFFLKENPTNNNKVTDLKLDRSIHKLFSDRMSKNVSVYIHIEFDDFNSSISAYPESLCIVFWMVMVDHWPSCYQYCQPLYHTFYISKLKDLNKSRRNAFQS